MQLLILTFSVAALALACDKGAPPSNGTAREAPGATHEAAAQEATTKARPAAPAHPPSGLMGAGPSRAVAWDCAGITCPDGLARADLVAP